MANYIVKRAAYGLITIFIVATATFFLMRLIPGGPFLSVKAPSPAVEAALNKKYGMDKPLFNQYVSYLKGAVQGDLGPSMVQRGWLVSDIIAQKFPVSAKLGGFAALIALAAGIPLGCIAAYKRGKTADRIISVFCAAGTAVPSFVICTVLMYYLGVKYDILPINGLEEWRSYIIPLFALSALPTAYVARLSRSSMLEVLDRDFIKTARAKGVKRFTLIFKHALRNAVIPVVTYVGPMLAYMITGSMVVETTLGIPGLGSDFVNSIMNRDYPLVMGTTIFLAFLIVLINIAVDILYKIIDPRIKLD